MKPKVLVIDDEPAICKALTLALESEYGIKAVTAPGKAIGWLKENSIDIVILDYILNDPELDGIAVLKKIKEIDKSIQVIIMTAFGTIKSSVEAMKNGALTYLTKPVDLEELNLNLNKALEFRRLNQRVAFLSDELNNRNTYGDIIGKAPSMQAVFSLIDKVKDTSAGILISGESGTGKELVARAVHFTGIRKQGPFIAVNCSAIPDGLLEEEFFGHKKGSFTGAVADRKGKFEMANGGTLFLDEIGDMSLTLQSKLLRVLQQQEFTPIGSNEVVKTNARIIAASNKNLKQMIRLGEFREDLYFRLVVVEIPMPPLRDRKTDISFLVERFLKRFNSQYGKSITGITQEAEKALLSYDYPGNVRELEHAIEYAVLFCSSDTIDCCDLPKPINPFGTENSGAGVKENAALDLSNISLRDAEKEIIASCLKRNNGNQRNTAKVLGISERGLRYKIREYGL